MGSARVIFVTGMGQVGLWDYGARRVGGYLARCWGGVLSVPQGLPGTLRQPFLDHASWASTSESSFEASWSMGPPWARMPWWEF